RPPPDGQRSLGHRPHRDHSPDRDREEERDPDDRLRDRRREERGEEPGAVDLPGVPPALPADHDDDDGRDARRPAPRARRRYGRRIAPPARHLDRRGAALLADVDPVHDAGRLPLPRPLPAPLGEAPGASPAAPAGSGAPGGVMKTGRREAESGRRWSFPGVVALVVLTLTGCAVGPNYKRPDVAIPTSFKEAVPEGNPAAAPEAWKPATPGDEESRGKWWVVFDDPLLNTLEEQVNISNQNIAQAEALFRGARAAVRGARSEFVPTITGTASFTRSQIGTNPPVNQYSLPVDLSYEVDVWGRVRRNVESSVAIAQASAADLAGVRLTMQSELALDY